MNLPVGKEYRHYGLEFHGEALALVDQLSNNRWLEIIGALGFFVDV